MKKTETKIGQSYGRLRDDGTKLIEIRLYAGMYAVPVLGCCLNGLYLTQCNENVEPYNGPWHIVGPNKYAVDAEWGGPYVYDTLDEAIAESKFLASLVEYSTCGGVITNKKTRPTYAEFI